MTERPIIAGWDGGDHGQDALALAAVLARIDGSQVIAAHAYHCPPPAYPMPEDYANALHAAADAQVRGIPRHILEGVRFDARKMPGRSPARALHELAVAEKASLVVLGSTHHGAVGRVILGTVADRLLNGAPCPIAIAPRGYSSHAAERLRVVAVGFDGSPDSAAAVTTAATTAQRAGATLRIVAIVEPIGKKLLGAAASLLEDVMHVERDWLTDRLGAVRSELPSDLEPEIDIHDGDPAHELIKAGSTADLLVLGSRDYGPVLRVMVGGASAEVVQKAPCPVLVVPRAAR